MTMLDNIFFKNILFFVLFLNFNFLYPTVVGSDSTPSRQGSVTFLQLDLDNEMNGFAAFETGFTFETANTSCTFDSFFPVSGTIDMSGGTLYLSKDLIFDTGTTLNEMGNIYGNGYKIKFSESVLTTTAFSSSSSLLESWSQVDFDSSSQNIYSVDWTYDDNYVLRGGYSNFLHIYSFNGSSLTEVGEINVGYDIYAIRSHPSGYYFAVGHANSNINVYKYSGGVLSFVDSEPIEFFKEGLSVAWSHDGSYLVVGYDEDVNVCSFSNETLTSIDTLDWGGDAVRQRAICWDQTNSHIVVGTTTNLRILYFNGSTVTSKKSLYLGTAIEAVDWSKTGSWVAVGTSGASNQLRVYEYDSSGNILTLRNQISVGATVRSLHWNHDATKLVVGKSTDFAGTELRLYDFDQGDYSLTLNLTEEKGSSIRDVRWSNDEKDLVFVGESTKFFVYSYNALEEGGYSDSVFLDNVSIELNNDMSWKMATTIQGDCKIDAQKNIITIEDTGIITVTTGATLTIENAEMRGLTSENLKCLSNNESITLRNCKICLENDLTFDTGSLAFEGEVVFTGTNKFIYSSEMVSTIASKATLIFEQDVTFKYAPTTNNRDLIAMSDETSFLYLNGAILHSTSTGIRLTKGSLILENGITFSCEGTELSEAICFGDGVESNDLTIKILSDADLTVYGALYCDNAN